MAFQNGDITVSQVGVKCLLSLGQGQNTLDFELFEARAVDKKIELQNILFHLAKRSLDLEESLTKANETISSLKQQKAAGAGAAGLLDLGDPGKKKGQPKAPPKQVGMSVINPGSKKRKAPRGIEFD